MERPQSRKRQHIDESSQRARPIKRIKSAGKCNFPPSFWDSLSKVPLTTRSLRELDRRNSKRTTRWETIDIYPTDLGRFARHGGPDLRHLRGVRMLFHQQRQAAKHPRQYLEPEIAEHNMNSSQSSQSRKTQSTKASSVTTKSKKSSAYGKDFERHLTDHKIYLPEHDYGDSAIDAEPGDLQQTVQALMAKRASLSPSQFSSSAFRNFKQKNGRAVSENDVMAEVFPIIRGNSSLNSQQNMLFTELEPITDEGAVRPKPDFFDGARPQDLSQTLRNDLQSAVIPTKHASVPVVPNFYMEAKGPDGSAAVAQRQACYDGAYGARAMQALQSYGETEPIYDGDAYTYSSTYHSGTGTLQLYAHHATAPTTPDGRPEYHMTQLKGYALTSDRETFVAGATAFRNARGLADRHRRAFIQAANRRASQSGVAADDIADANDVQDSIGSTDYSGGQDADDALQQQIADTNPIAYDDTVSADVPHYLHPEEDSQELSQGPTALDFDDPSMSFTSSFTSVSTERARSKRARQPDSPPSNWDPDSAISSSNDLHWVGTYEHKGNICFRDPDKERREYKTEKKDWTEHVLDGTRSFYWTCPKSGRTFWAMEISKRVKKKGHR